MEIQAQFYSEASFVKGTTKVQFKQKQLGGRVCQRAKRPDV